MATKKIELIFDLDAKDVQFATDKTLSLTEQIRILKKELQKTQEGTKEFEILRNKLNDTKDNFERVNAKSRELFGTLQLIPGPIGEIASKIDGAVSLLKTFSGFSLKDIQNQFKAFGADITGIINNFLGLKESTDQVREGIDGINDTNVRLADSQANVNSSTQNLTNSLTASAVVTNRSAQSSQTLTLAHEAQFVGANKAASAENLLTDAERRKIPIIETNAIAYALKNKIVTQSELNARQAALAENQLTTATVEQTGASQGATGALAGQAAATEAVTLASRAATFAVNALKIATGAIILTALITGVTYLFGALKELVTGAKAAEAENKRLGESFELLKRSIDETQQSIVDQTKLLKTQAETAGKSADEIADIERKGLQKRIDANKKASEEILRQTALVAANSILTEEDRTKKIEELQTQSIENGRKLTDLQAEQRQFEADDEKRKAEERRKRQDKAVSDAKEQAAKLKQIRDQELDEIEKGRKEAFLTQLTDREREEYLVNEKYVKLQALAIKYKQDTNDLEAARLAELAELRKKYDKEDLDERIKSINAIIEKEENAAVVDVERLKKLLLHKRDLELQNAELLGEEREAIVVKYDKQLRDIETKQREDKLIADIAATRGNFDAQIELYRQYAEEAINSEKYTEQEKVKIIEDANTKIRQLQQERFEATLTAAQLEYGEKFAYDADYYNKVRSLYDTEEQNYKDLLAQKKISQAEFDAFMKDSADARISLDKAELDAKMANFEAVSAIFSASASLVGEQTKAGKALSIASATIDTYVSANKVLADPTPMPTFLRFALAAGAIIRGLASVKKIVDTKLPTPGGATTDAGSQGTKPQGTINVNAKMAQGGMVTGPGSGTSDSIPAMLSNGEYVVNARSTRLFQPLLAAINDYGLSTPAFAAGGLAVQQQLAPRMDNTERIAEAITLGISNQPIRTYVTSSDVTNQQQFDRVIKSRSLI